MVGVVALDNVTVSITMLVGMVVMFFRFSSAIGKFQANNDAMTRQLDRLQQKQDAFDRIPLLEQAVGQLKETITRQNSLFPAFSSRLAVVEKQMEIQTRGSWTNEWDNKRGDGK